MKIAILGSGNIGSALVTGLLCEGSIAPEYISLTDISHEALAPFTAKGVHTMQNNADAVKDADVVVLCVKPYLYRDIIEEIIPSLTGDALLVSVAAGISLYEQWIFALKGHCSGQFPTQQWLYASR